MDSYRGPSKTGRVTPLCLNPVWRDYGIRTGESANGGHIFVNDKEVLIPSGGIMGFVLCSCTPSRKNNLVSCSLNPVWRDYGIRTLAWQNRAVLIAKPKRVLIPSGGIMGFVQPPLEGMWIYYDTKRQALASGICLPLPVRSFWFGDDLNLLQTGEDRRHFDPK